MGGRVHGWCCCGGVGGLVCSGGMLVGGVLPRGGAGGVVAVFIENIGHKYDFQEGGVVSGRVWGWGMVQIQRKKF